MVKTYNYPNGDLVMTGGFAPAGDFFLVGANDIYVAHIKEKEEDTEVATSLSEITNVYILDVDYNTLLKFNTSEIVIGNAASGGGTTAKLGVAVLGTMVLGQA